MNTEEKEKLMLADDLTDYINKKMNQDKCIGFIDGYEAAISKLKILGISNVGVTLCDHPRNERTYIGSNMLRCDKCGKEFK